VSAIIFGRQIQSQEVAVHLDSSATIASTTRRVKRFLELYTIDYEFFTILMLHFIPPGAVKLCMDRTNWKFGSMSINFLVISVYANGIGIPIWFELLDNKGGNSHTNDRISALDQCIELLGKDRIECFIADREFIGKKWINFLLTNHLNFYIRVRQNQWVEIEGKQVQIVNLLKNKTKNYEFDNVGIFDTYLSMGLKYLPRKDECLAVITNTFGHLALNEYENRWSEEVSFQAIKGRGFNLESTHLQDFVKLRKLFAICSLALALCHHLGFWKHEEIKALAMKNHGYKENSFFRYGLEYIRSYIKHDFTDSKPFIYLEKLIQHNFLYLYYRDKNVP